ncbi:hypothetical protein GOBAR_AA32392 [Gossypium barbadense]|uniref:Uncharacterized protein n=1 Tax=Gossypium barbadense TaxID=3634 RepID=A0A2P5WB66_GOSBA|nr:hypothetical protein GOBAR_AA32392 [Gossypium barbadense]
MEYSYAGEHSHTAHHPTNSQDNERQRNDFTPPYQPGHGAAPMHQPGYAAVLPHQPGYGAAPPHQLGYDAADMHQAGYGATLPHQPGYGAPPQHQPGYGTASLHHLGYRAPPSHQAEYGVAPSHQAEAAQLHQPGYGAALMYQPGYGGNYLPPEYGSYNYITTPGHVQPCGHRTSEGRFDHHLWYKDDKFGSNVKDEEGFPSFALVNKATGLALKHASGATQLLEITRLSLLKLIPPMNTRYVTGNYISKIVFD